MKYYFISGEASGDLHASFLSKALQAEDPAFEARGWGGDLLAATGVTIDKHYEELAIMGIGQVLKKLPTILANFKQCKAAIEAFQPDALILIDYSGFNLRLAKWAKAAGYTIFYYIAPQVWATRAKRVQTIKRCVDQLFVILPFEPAFYEQYNYQAHFIGHPLLDIVKAHPLAIDFRAANQLDDRPIIALLPGSRKQEISAMLPVMLETSKVFPQYQFIIAGAPSMTADFYYQLHPSLQNSQDKKEVSNVRLLQGQTYDLLAHSHAALVTSGTATLETALFQVPQIVCYKTSPLFYAIVKRIIKVRYISIVNLIMDAPLVEELIQKELTKERLQPALQAILGGPKRAAMLTQYQLLKEKLGSGGAARRAARQMLTYLQTSKA